MRPDRRPDLSVIVPTLNEARNLLLLVPRIAWALAARTASAGRRAPARAAYEILLVDDASADDTAEVVADLAERYPVRLITRTDPADGLSGAVLEGLRQARGRYLLVMDADLQHPPEQIPDLLAPLEEGRADFVLGSRYVEGGTVGREWTAFRKLNSKVATWLARPFAGRTLDPMSGFFALTRAALARGRYLTPLGYKIALELMCKCRIPADRILEVPIQFGARQAGESKLTVGQQFKYLEHLSRLYDFFFPRVSPVAKFVVATAAGWLVGWAVYLLALGKGAAQGLVAPPPGVAIAYAAAVLATAAFHLRYVRTQRPFLVRPRPWRDFALISLAEWAAACFVATFCSLRVIGVTAAELFTWSFAAATVVRYVLRKELLQDVRGLRKGVRFDHLAEDQRRAPVSMRRAA